MTDNSERNEAIKRMYTENKSYAKTAAVFGLSRERVRQIVQCKKTVTLPLADHLSNRCTLALARNGIYTKEQLEDALNSGGFWATNIGAKCTDEISAFLKKAVIAKRRRLKKWFGHEYGERLVEWYRCETEGHQRRVEQDADDKC